MTYLVFKNTKFVAHTNDKKILKRFLKERKNEYSIQELKTELISSELKDSEEFFLSQLDLYNEYDIVMTEQELMNVFDIVRDRLKEILLLKKELRAEMKYVKLKGEENLIMSQFFEFIDVLEEDLNMDLDMDFESSVFLNDYFNVKSIIDIIIRK